MYSTKLLIIKQHNHETIFVQSFEIPNISITIKIIEVLQTNFEGQEGSMRAIYIKNMFKSNILKISNCYIHIQFM